MTRTGIRERVAVGLVALALGGTAGELSGQTLYRTPPRAILDVLDAEPTPFVSMNPTRDTVLLIQTASYPAIADLAQPILRLAGDRINPRTNGPVRTARVTALTLMPVEGGHPRPVKLPEVGKVGVPEWSPDGKRYAVMVTTDAEILLYVGNVATAGLKRFPHAILNAAHGDPVKWMPDSKSLLCQLVPAGRGKPPEAPLAPPGPTVQESSGNAAPVRTFQDMLANAHDEALFDYYATSQLALCTFELPPLARTLGEPGVFANAQPSPDGKFVLATRIKKPYSYLYPASAFPPGRRARLIFITWRPAAVAPRWLSCPTGQAC